MRSGERSVQRVARSQGFSSRLRATLGAFTLLMALTAPPGSAHSTSTSFLSFDASAMRGRWDLAVADLEWTVDLDKNYDGQVTWAEITAAESAITRVALRGLTLLQGNVACVIERVAPLQMARHADEPYVVLTLGMTCPQPGALSVTTDLFFGMDASARTLLSVVGGSGATTSALGPATPTWRESLRPSGWSTFATFIREGAWHVWIGYDHLAFLLLLMLPAAMGRSLRDCVADLVRIVTAFTVAHSITLALATTGTLMPPAAPIEAAIAASIVVAGLLNLRPALSRWRVALAFGFGLVHGFGFANALAELGTGGAGLLPVLAGFNVGVELAQLSLVAVALPVLRALSGSPLYEARLLPAMSLGVAVLGATWFAQRVG